MQDLISHPLFTPLLLTALIVLGFPLLTGYLVHVERKILADMQARLGPMRAGPHGLLQPLADALKLLLKEDVVPAGAGKDPFWMAPLIAALTGPTAIPLLPFCERLYVADMNVGLLIISALGAVGVLGMTLGGWASNSHYSLLGSLRGAAQLVSYEVAVTLAMLAPVMSASSLSLVEIVQAQQRRGIWFVFDNFGLMIVTFGIFLIAAVAETNRAPFDLPEAESELVAGFHTEYSGFRWALFMLGEYAHAFVICGVTVVLFFGGWLRPFPGVAWLEVPLNFAFPVLLISGSGASSLLLVKKVRRRWQRVLLLLIAGALISAGLVFLIPAVNAILIGPFWFFLKLALVLYLLFWLRGTLPRLRYDQLMNLGWKYLIPLALLMLLLNAVVGLLGA